MFTFNKNVTAIDNLSEEGQEKKIRFAFCQAKNMYPELITTTQPLGLCVEIF
jgi:hypothetical protein